MHIAQSSATGWRSLIAGVYIYASCKPRPVSEFARMGVEPGDLMTGVLVGTVEIIDCSGKPGDYKWHLARPRRLKRPVPLANHPNEAT
jgi:hypothetical protein